MRDFIKAQLAIAWPDLHIVGMAENGIEALRLADELAPDIVFLDIQMPGLTGLDVAARLSTNEHGPHIVFVTAYDHHAVAAFDQAAFDYLLKPVTAARLERTVARLRAAVGEKPAGEAEALRALLEKLGVTAAPKPAPLQWIRAAHGKETRLIPIDDVIYFQSNDKYTSVFTAEGESLIRTSMRELRDGLDEQRFWQIHRGVIVAAKAIAGTHTDFRGRLMVKLKGRTEQLVVSRNYTDQFRQM
ncbi:MAG: LytTR family DNA-binding domain-containing protein [Pseudomonadota bacterium]|nr:LytTR family DNA-binding domain-containing protein [Pseudomonadota bacterium]